MLIEQAFLKLPELLLSNFDHGSEIELTIVHLFASALQMEMNARNIPRPFASVLMEKPYEGISSNRRAVRADLYVDLSSAVRFDGRILAYGVRPKNWIEAKAPLMTRRRSPAVLRPKQLVRDCFRLCLLPKEWPGFLTTENGRYLLWVLDKDPRKSLQKASWVRPMLEPGIHLVRFDSHSSEVTQSMSLEASVYTLSFEPNPLNAGHPLFWGYLLRLGRFKVWDKQQSFIADDMQGKEFSHEAINALEALRQAFLLKEDKSTSGSEDA